MFLLVHVEVQESVGSHVCALLPDTEAHACTMPPPFAPKGLELDLNVNPCTRVCACTCVHVCVCTSLGTCAWACSWTSWARVCVHV